MDLEEIRNIIETDGGRFIIVEKGKPALVIMSLEDYKAKLAKFSTPGNPVNPLRKESGLYSPQLPREAGFSNGVKKEKQEIFSGEKNPIGRPAEELTIEDLPV